LIGSLQHDFARGIDIVDDETAIETGLIAIAKHNVRSGRDNEPGAHGNERGVIVGGGIGNGPALHVDTRQARIVHFKPFAAHIFGFIGIVHDFGNDQDGGRIGGKDRWRDLTRRRRLGRLGRYRWRDGAVIGSTGRAKVTVAVASRRDAPIGTDRIVQGALSQGHARARDPWKSRPTPIHDIDASTIGIHQDERVAASQAHFAPRIHVIDARNATIELRAIARTQYGIAIRRHNDILANDKCVVPRDIGNAPTEQIDGTWATIVQFYPFSPYILNLGWIGHDFIQLEAIASAIHIGQCHHGSRDCSGSGSHIVAVIGSTGRAVIAATKGTATRCAPMGTHPIVQGDRPQRQGRASGGRWKVSATPIDNINASTIGIVQYQLVLSLQRGSSRGKDVVDVELAIEFGLIRVAQDDIVVGLYHETVLNGKRVGFRILDGPTTQIHRGGSAVVQLEPFAALVSRATRIGHDFGNHHGARHDRHNGME
jgi:hypothetical protein